MSFQNDNTAIVFTDIVGSSLLYSSYGNQKAKTMIDQAITCMIKIVENHSGQVIKTIGDEVMCSFPDPEQACEAAINMNQELGQLDFKLRTGLCFGKVIQDKNDYYGDTVNNAAFLAQTAQANQILFDSNTLANLPSGLREHSEYFDRISLKGRTKQSLVYRLNWEAQEVSSLDATIVTTKAVSSDADIATQLMVNYKDNTYYLNSSSSLCIGRDSGSVHLCVDHKNASRKHCSLYFHRGKFVFEDHSTNGSYLLQKGQKELFLRRESIPLLTDGRFSLGQPCKASGDILDYYIE